MTTAQDSITAAPLLTVNTNVKTDTKQLVQFNAQWACKVSAVDDRGQPVGELKEPLTVGAHFLLSCEGTSVNLAKEKLALEIPKEQKYVLRLLETRSLTDSRGEFVATSWVAGEHKLENPILTDSVNRIALGPIEYKFATVIDPQKNQAQNPEQSTEQKSGPQPFPPWAPLLLPLPTYLWVSVALLFGLIVLAIWLRVKKVFARKKFMKLLDANPVAQKPYFHFNKELRRLSRDMPTQDANWTAEHAQRLFNDLDSAFRWYLARELVLPVFDRNPGDIVRDLQRKNEKLCDEIRKDLTMALQELKKASTSVSRKNRVALADAQQIIDLTRVVADRIHGKEIQE